jgi:iron(III) transport system substrate-binding protein
MRGSKQTESSGQGFWFALIIAVYAIILAALTPARASGGMASGWEAEWTKTVEAAKKEGQVTIYLDPTYEKALVRPGVFQKAYPGIRVITVVGRPSEIAQRLLAERRGGKYLADLVAMGLGVTLESLHGAKALDPIKPALILPEVVDEANWWQGKHHYADPEAMYVFRVGTNLQTGSISYNSTLVNPAEFTSFWDFLHPKWKNKIEARDIRRPGTGVGAMRLFYYNLKVGPDFIRRLFSEMNVTLFRDIRQGTDWLAAGKFAICFFCSPAQVSDAASKGLPVGSFGPMKEGVGLVTTLASLALPTSRPHPNASKVFLNWYLSRDGQITLQKELHKLGDDLQSLRTDIPVEYIPPESRRPEGGNYVDLDSRQEWLQREPFLKVFEEAMAQSVK